MYKLWSLGLVTLLCIWSVGASAQPAVDVMTTPMIAVPSVAPSTTTPAMTAIPATTPVTDPMVAIDVVSPDPMAVPPALTMPKAEVQPPVVHVAAPEPMWKSPSFWIGIVGGPLLSIILGVLVAFGIFGQQQINWLKRNKIVEIADKVVTQFEKFASGTSPKWDDVLAQALRAVVDRVGTLTEDQQTLVKSVVEERQAQAEKTKTEEKKEAEVVEVKAEEKKPSA